jgi:hypothetical protein
MTCQLLADCLNEIIEYLEEDRHTLHSCLLVNRLWCEISVKILWRNIWNFEDLYQQHTETSIFSTLFDCLPNESKELLYKNKISISTISTYTSKQPLFNYATFCKVLSVYEIGRIVDTVFRYKPCITALSIKERNYLITNEIIKMFANQIHSLKRLSCYHYYFHTQNFSFPCFPGAKDLSELRCCSCLPSNFFYQLSQICHNIQTLSINFHNYDASNELKELISLQNNLKNLELSTDKRSWANIIPVLTKHSHTITKLRLYGDSSDLPSSFASLFTNLQELIFSFLDGTHFEDFKMLQYVNYSKLHTLKIPYQCPRPEYVMKFLENNGKNLIKFHIDESNKALSLSIANFCTNLKSLFVLINSDELDILKTIFINCKYLESIKVYCGKGNFCNYLSEKEIFETIINHSSNNFCELKIFNISKSDVSSEDLESFFISWKNRTSKKLLSLIIIKDNYGKNLNYYEENMKIIEEYENLGIIKFRTIWYEEEDKEEEVNFYYY